MSKKTITHDASSGADMTTTNSFTISHTVGSYTNRLLVVCVTARLYPQSCTSVTYAGVNLTKAVTNGYANFDTTIWYLVNPATGANNVVVTLSGNDTGRGMIGIASFYNVNVGNPLSLTSTANGEVTTSVTNSFTSLADGCMAIHCMGTDSDAGGTEGSGETVIKKRASADSGGSTYKALGTYGSESMAWTNLSAGSSIASAVAVFNPASTPRVIFIS